MSTEASGAAARPRRGRRPAGTDNRQRILVAARARFAEDGYAAATIRKIAAEAGVDAAAEQPPHLAAINPWEGVSDVYRDLVLRGGMPDTGFARQLRDYSFWGGNRKEDILAEADRHPLMSDLWANKIPDFDKITVPAYVVASYSNTLHTAGTFRAWRRIASPRKWLRIHNGQE